MTEPHVRAFFDDIADHPDDATVRLVFADWLAERDDPRAELLRLQAHYLHAARPEAERILTAVGAWERAHRADWLGPLPAQGVALRLAKALLEVMGYSADALLAQPDLTGLHRALREGWLATLRMTHWSDAQVTRASELDLLVGPHEVEFLGGALTNASLKHLGNLPRLRSLHVGGNQLAVTDAGLAHLRGASGLRQLHLWGLADLTGAGLEQLTDLRDLRELSFYNCARLGAVGLQPLARCRPVERLSLGQCPALTGTALADLTQLPALRFLRLDSCAGIDDAALEHVARLTSLRHLELAECPVTDAGLTHLAGLTELTELQLFRCPHLTGAGLAHLHGLKNLQRLDVRGMKLKPNETRALRKALPGCEVVRK